MLSFYFYIFYINNIHPAVPESYKKKVQLFFAGKQKVRTHLRGVFNSASGLSRLALFFCIRTKGELESIRQVLPLSRDSGRSVTAFVFYDGFDTPDVVTDKSIFFFNLNDFTLFGAMKENLRKNLQETAFELLISFSQADNPICRQLVSEINADFKAGPDHPGSSDLYDLKVDADVQQTGFVQFYRQLSHYLKVLNIQSRRS
ncbi:MAG: hypothetical protein L3J66_03630 [Bacteroidales bacterium]|nr:hypothetical protein [Bacteroidales bacterium]